MRQYDSPFVLHSPTLLNPVGQCDCDCACVLDVADVPVTRVDFGARLHRVPAYSFPLDGEWQVTFNPAGPVGVVALNAMAGRVLNSFGEPGAIDRLAARLPTLEPLLAEQAAARLVRVGLLRPVDAAPPDQPRSPSVVRTLSAWLHVAEACNLRCPYCYVPKRARLASVESGLRAVDRLLGLARQHGYGSLQLKYAGGEPTLNFPVVWATHQHALRATAAAGLSLKEVLLTNGVDVADAALDAIAEAGMKLMVSLDGGPTSHGQTRGRPGGTSTYEAVVSTVDRARSRGLHVDISITLTALNLDGVPDAVAFALGRHLPFSLNFYRECNTTQKTAQAALSRLRPDPDRLISTVRRSLSLLEAQPAYPLPLTGILDRVRLDVPHCHPCSAGRDYLAIDLDGRVSACQMLLGDPWAELDDEDPLLAVRERGASIFRAADEYEECRGCQWQAACSSGCPLLHDSSLHSAYCQVYQALLPDLIRLEGKRLIALHQSAQLM